MPDLEPTTFVQRVVLCCFVKTDAENMPIDAAELRSFSRELLEAAEGQSVSAVSEGDVARALNGLVDMGLIEEHRPENNSPVGKGRPKYTLEIDSDSVREELQTGDISSLLN